MITEPASLATKLRLWRGASCLPSRNITRARKAAGLLLNGKPSGMRRKNKKSE